MSFQLRYYLSDDIILACRVSKHLLIYSSQPISWLSLCAEKKHWLVSQGIIVAEHVECVALNLLFVLTYLDNLDWKQ